MADKCYSIFTFFGNKGVNEQVSKWNTELQKHHHPSKDQPYSPQAIFDVLLPEEKPDALSWFGQKWVYPDFGSEISIGKNELGFVSAWGSPNGLQDLLTTILAEIDGNVVILNSYTSPEYEEAFRYSCVGGDGGVRSAGTNLQFMDEQDPDSGLDYTLFYEHQVDSICELIDEVPGIKKSIDKELKRVEKLFEKALKNSA